MQSTASMCACNVPCMCMSPARYLYMDIFVCVNLQMCVGQHSRVSLPLTALKINDLGAQESTNVAPAGHNRVHDLHVDVFENRSSFFSVSTSLPPHNRRIHYTNSHVMPELALFVRKCVAMWSQVCVRSSTCDYLTCQCVVAGC